MSRKRTIRYLTPSEIIATIRHSALPTLVAEGKDDVFILRRLEEDLAATRLSLIPAGGKNAILEVFRRRDELPSSSKVIFFVDKDLWVIFGTPTEFVSTQLLLTDGYSIENDMFVDGELASLLTATERRLFDADLEVVDRWFAIAAARHLAGRCTRLGVHPREILDDEARRSEHTQLLDGEEFPFALSERIRKEYHRLLRGKTLLNVLIRHQPGQSCHTLLNFGASRRGPLFTELRNRVADYIVNSKS